MAEKLNSSDSLQPEQDSKPHTPSSYSRTSNPKLTPKDKASLEKLKTKMFSDSGTSGATAERSNLDAVFEVDGLTPAELLAKPVMGDGKVLISSEQLKQISTILESPKILFDVLAKLHQLHSYKHNACGLYDEVKQGASPDDPQEAQNLVRMANLITDIKQHELSYLRVLQQLMLQANTVSNGPPRSGNDGGLNSLDHNRTATTEDTDQSEEEEDEEEGDDNEDVRQEQLVHELVEAEHQREIEALREQKAILLKLIEQQRQLKDLETKQTSLTSVQNEAKARLSEIQQRERLKLNNEVAEPPSTEEGPSRPSRRKAMNDAQAEEDCSNEENHEEDGDDDDDEELDEETKASLLQELHQLRERKERLNKLLTDLSDGNLPQEGASQQPEITSRGRAGAPVSQGSLLHKSFTPITRVPAADKSAVQHKVTWSAPPTRPPRHTRPPHPAKPLALSQQVTSHFAPSEVVDVLPPAVEKKLQNLNHAKGKLEDVQKMLSQAGLNDSSIVSSPEKYSWNNDTSDTEDKESRNESVEAELEARINQQKEELQLLMRKKQELLEMKEMLRHLQLKQQGEVPAEEDEDEEEEDEEGFPEDEEDDGTAYGHVPPPPSSAQQHQLYDELVRKNKQLRLAQRKSNDLDDPEGSSVQYSWDVTAATWGGSTAHTMESEGMSMYSNEDFDTTKETTSQQEESEEEEEEEVQEGLLEGFSHILYPHQMQDTFVGPLSASRDGLAEDETTSRETYTVNMDVPVSVQRHTPRHTLDSIQRPTVSSGQQQQQEEEGGGAQQLTPRSAGKKRRLEVAEVDEWPQQFYNTDPEPLPFFPARHEASLNSSFNRWAPQPASAPAMSGEYQQLQRQLADSTTMCSELLRSQVQLVGLVSQRFAESGPGFYTPGGGLPYSAPPYGSLGGYQRSRPPPLSSLDQYMKQLQEYHQSLQAARDQLTAQYSHGPSASSHVTFEQDSVHLPPPPPSMPRTQHGHLFTPGSVTHTSPMFQPPSQLGKPFGSPAFDFSPAGKSQKPASSGHQQQQQNVFSSSAAATGPFDWDHGSHGPTAHQPASASANLFGVQRAGIAPTGPSSLAQGSARTSGVRSTAAKPKGSSPKPAPGPQPSVYTTIAQRSRQLAMEEFTSESQGGPSVSSLLPSQQQQQQQLQDSMEREEGSESSMPCSLPGDLAAGRHKMSAKVTEQESHDENGSSQNYSLFDALRETIYSEVATLIANNESRPHFLIELFRELQLLTTDYLRQRALYGVQDLVTRFLTEESLEAEASGFNPMNYQSWLASTTTEQTASESAVTTSEVLSEGEDNPFEQDDLGDTVIHFGDSLTHARELTEADATLVATPLAQEARFALDSQQLDSEIKAVMMHVIPILKDNLPQVCTAELLVNIQQPVVRLVMELERPQREFVEILSRQLETSVAATLAKYQGKVLSDCGENLLVDLSEVLFNELGFFRVLQDMKVDPSTIVDTSQPPSGTVQAVAGVLASPLAVTIEEEEEALGNTRDDELAVNCDFSKVHSVSMTTDDEQAVQTPNAKAQPKEEPKPAEPSDSKQPPASNAVEDEVQKDEGNTSEPTEVPQEVNQTVDQDQEVNQTVDQDQEVDQEVDQSTAQLKPAAVDTADTTQHGDQVEPRSPRGSSPGPSSTQEGLPPPPASPREPSGEDSNGPSSTTVTQPLGSPGADQPASEASSPPPPPPPPPPSGDQQVSSTAAAEEEPHENADCSLASARQVGQSGSEGLDVQETSSDIPSSKTVSNHPMEQAGISVQREQIASRLMEEQKVVSGVPGILQSLAEVPEIVGSDIPIEPAVPEP